MSIGWDEVKEKETRGETIWNLRTLVGVIADTMEYRGFDSFVNTYP